MRGDLLYTVPFTTPFGKLVDMVAMWTLRRTSQRFASLVVFAVVFGALYSMHHLRRNHYLLVDSFRPPVSGASSAHGHDISSDTGRICHIHGFTPWITTESTRKIYDLVLISTELDWFEIRLQTLW